MPKIIDAVYIELDALLDTRLGTIARHAPVAAETVLANGYHRRDSDVFAGFDGDFSSLYKQRDVVTLAHSGVTNMVLALQDIIQGMASEAAVTPLRSGVKLIVNTYPYVLTREEEIELGKSCVDWTNQLALVELVTLSPVEVSPSFCRTNRIGTLVMYDYETWLNSQAEAFKQATLATTTLFAPAIYFLPVPTEEEIRQKVAKVAHPLQAVEMLVVPFIDLRLLDIDLFSVLSMERLPPGKLPPSFRASSKEGPGKTETTDAVRE